mmetsp:Transcript_52387/g.77540  ORF Transcript_52387/g.77540 Transcript_52387/m.77540 type:complete len:239 (-) Transcript_52387:554-1270(-)
MVIHHSRVRVTRRRGRTSSCCMNYFTPGHGIGIKPKKVRYTRSPIKSTKHIKCISVNNRYMTIPWTRWRARGCIGYDRTPSLFGEGEGVKVVDSCLTVVSAKHVQYSIQNRGTMQRSGTGRHTPRRTTERFHHRPTHHGRRLLDIVFMRHNGWSSGSMTVCSRGIANDVGIVTRSSTSIPGSGSDSGRGLQDGLRLSHGFHQNDATPLKTGHLWRLIARLCRSRCRGCSRHSHRPCRW